MPEVTILAVRVDLGWREYIEYVVFGPRGGSVSLPSGSVAAAVARYYTDQEVRRCSREEREQLLRKGVAIQEVQVRPVRRVGRQIGTTSVFLDKDGADHFIGVAFNGAALTSVGEEAEVEMWMAELEAKRLENGHHDGGTAVPLPGT